MNAKGIIKKYLMDNGYDGLACSFPGDCGCDVDDLAPCGCIDIEGCVPARKKPCYACSNLNCEYRGEGDGCYIPDEN